MSSYTTTTTATTTTTTINYYGGISCISFIKCRVNGRSADTMNVFLYKEMSC